MISRPPRYHIEMFMVDGQEEVSYVEVLRPQEDPFFTAQDCGALYYVLHEVDKYGETLSTSGRHFLLEEHHHLLSAAQVKLILTANLYFSNNEESDFSAANMKKNIKSMEKQPDDAVFIFAGRNRFLQVQKQDVVLDQIGDQIWPKKPPKRKPAPKSAQEPKPGL